MAIYNSAGTNVDFYAPANPTGTASLTAVMAGMGSTIAYTPKYGSSSQIVIILDCDVSNSVATDGITVQLAYGTGTAPINGAAASGTTSGAARTRTSGAANRTYDISFVQKITGLVPGTAYWFDLQFLAVTGGTASIANATCTIQEVLNASNV